MQGPVSSFGVSFKKGLGGGAIVFALLAVWAMVRSGDTAQTMQAFIPFKTTMIEKEVPKTVNTEENFPIDPTQPALRTLPGGKVLNPLPAAPVDGLYENANGRQLPMARIQDDMTPFQAYKAPFAAVAGRAQVSLVVVDFGLSSKLAQSLLDNMPPEISFVLTPYSDDPTKWASAARAYGHEFWLSLPMETKSASGVDAGPDALVANGSLEQNQSKLLDVLGTAAGYAGVVTTKDHKLASDDISAEPILKQIYGRGLAIAESNPDVPAYGLSAAMQDGYPYVQNNFWLDSDLRPEAIDRMLQQVELQATRKGKVIAFFHPYPVVVKRVNEWMNGTEGRGIQLAPLSATVQ